MDIRDKQVEVLSAIAPHFSYLDEAEYEQIRAEASWSELFSGEEIFGVISSAPAVSATAPVASPSAVAVSSFAAPLALPSLSARIAVQNEVLTSGAIFAAMPVESLYKPWSTQDGNSFGAQRGLYLGECSHHLLALYERLALEVPPAFSAMPDHLTLELELLAMLLEVHNYEGVSQLVSDHFDWLGDYADLLTRRIQDVRESPALESHRRAHLDEGLCFLLSLVRYSDRLVHSLVHLDPASSSAAHLKKRTLPKMAASTATLGCALCVT